MNTSTDRTVMPPTGLSGSPRRVPAHAPDEAEHLLPDSPQHDTRSLVGIAGP